MTPKHRLLQEVKLRASRAKEGKDGVRHVIKQGGKEDLANFMRQHANDKFRKRR